MDKITKTIKYVFKLWLLSFLLYFPILSVFIPTDYPRQPGDSLLDIFKVTAAITLGVLTIFLWRKFVNKKSISEAR